MTSWVSRLLPRNGRSLASASENQRAEDRHRHQEAYGYILPIQTRWQDNDQYGHVNNVVYYSYFDTIINQYLIRSVRGSASPILMSPFWHALVGASAGPSGRRCPFSSRVFADTAPLLKSGYSGEQPDR